MMVASWVTVDFPGFSAGEVGGTSIAIDKNGTPYVVYGDAAYAAKATSMKYNGSDWVTVGSPGFSMDFAAQPRIAIDKNGTPYVVYTDENGVDFNLTVMKYGTFTGIINRNNPVPAISIFPNPNHGSFTLNISSVTKEDATITITNMLGEKIEEFTTVTNQQTQIQLFTPPGIYFITATTNSQTITSKNNSTISNSF